MTNHNTKDYATIRAEVTLPTGVKIPKGTVVRLGRRDIGGQEIIHIDGSSRAWVKPDVVSEPQRNEMRDGTKVVYNAGKK